MSAVVTGRRGRGAGWALAAGVAVIVVHNASTVLAMRARSDDYDHPLAHDAIVGSGDRTPLRLDVLGDSSASGYGLEDATLAWPQQVAARLGGLVDVPVAVRCVAVRGARMRHVTELQVPKLDDPDVVAVSVGANDVLGRRLPWQVRRDAAVMLDAVRAAAPRAAIVLGGPGALGEAPALPWPLNRLLTWHARTVARHQERAAEDRGVPFGVLPPLPEDHFGPDGFHGGALAHMLAADMTLEALGKAFPTSVQRRSIGA